MIFLPLSEVCQQSFREIGHQHGNSHERGRSSQPLYPEKMAMS